MRTVLGIDAAWTPHNPSGVAMVEETEGGWRVIAVEPSYRRFVALAGGPRIETGTDARPDVAALLEACQRLTGRRPDMVALDMPLSRRPIVGRRSPTERFRGPTALANARRIRRAGFDREKSATSFARISKRPLPPLDGSAAVVEPAGPHRSLSASRACRTDRSFGAAEIQDRQIGNYGANSTPPSARRGFSRWGAIVAALEAEVAGVEARLPKVAPDARGAALKAFEDALDAVVCAWVGIRVLEGRAKAYGDAELRDLGPLLANRLSNIPRAAYGCCNAPLCASWARH